MAATGFTPISLYYSTTAAGVPVNTNLVSGELALNITDEKLYFKNAGGTVKLLASNAGSSATVSSVAQSFTGGLISVGGSPVTTSGTLALTVAGTSGGVPYFSSGTTWATSAALAANALVIGGGAGAAPSTTTTATGALTFLGTPSSANFAALLTDETGTGLNVFATSPTLTTPTISGYLESPVALGTVTGTATIAITAGTIITATLTASTPCTFTMPTATSGKSFVLQLTNSATGMTTATFTGVKWPGGTAPVITATASAVDIISFVCIGSTWYGNAAQAFA